jgi:uncharacterized membrane protein YdjX (TVP38/TMEM64 family)
MNGVPSKNSHWPKILVLAILLTGAALLSRYLSRDQILALMDRVRGFGFMGYVISILAFGIWCALGLPASLLSLAAAATFGFWKGFMVVFLGDNLGAVFGLYLSRYFAREWFTGLVGKRLPIAEINRAVTENGWRIVAITRVPPISPFAIVNYAYGLTSVRLAPYAIGTAIGIIPGTAAYVYLGTMLGNVADAPPRTRTPLEWSLYFCGFAITVAVCIYLVRVAKSALARHAIGK